MTSTQKQINKFYKKTRCSFFFQIGFTVIQWHRRWLGWRAVWVLGQMVAETGIAGWVVICRIVSIPCAANSSGRVLPTRHLLSAQFAAFPIYSTNILNAQNDLWWNFLINFQKLLRIYRNRALCAALNDGKMFTFSAQHQSFQQWNL